MYKNGYKFKTHILEQKLWACWQLQGNGNTQSCKTTTTVHGRNWCMYCKSVTHLWAISRKIALYPYYTTYNTFIHVISIIIRLFLSFQNKPVILAKSRQPNERPCYCQAEYRTVQISIAKSTIRGKLDHLQDGNIHKTMTAVPPLHASMHQWLTPQLVQWL